MSECPVIFSFYRFDYKKDMFKFFNSGFPDLFHDFLLIL